MTRKELQEKKKEEHLEKRKKECLGMQIGNYKISSVFRKDRWIMATCECLKCGFVQDYILDRLLLSKERDKPFTCPECSKKARLEEHLRKAKEEIGKQYGDLLILDVFRSERKSKTRFDAKYRCSCRNIGVAPLSKVKDGVITKCPHESEKILKNGREIGSLSFAEGTSIFSHTAKLSKASTTGVKGVCFTKDGKYRAYINFRRKHYHLGTYLDLDQAKAAREEAEKKLYGEFEEWYREKFPEKWERIQKIVEKKKEQKDASEKGNKESESDN